MFRVQPCSIGLLSRNCSASCRIPILVPRKFKPWKFVFLIQLPIHTLLMLMAAWTGQKQNHPGKTLDKTFIIYHLKNWQSSTVCDPSVGFVISRKGRPRAFDAGDVLVRHLDWPMVDLKHAQRIGIRTPSPSD